MKVSVTQDDIACGRAGEADSCPIALAISRAQPDCRVSVGAVAVFIQPRGKTARVTLLPRLARLFVWAFDSQRSSLKHAPWNVYMRPFEFELS